MQAIIHDDFIQRYIKRGDHVLDAGSGPGRFSITATRAGAKVTLLDISEKQLEIAGSNVTIAEHSPTNEKIAAEPLAWATLIELEQKINHNPGLLDCGSHILLAARVLI